MIYDAKFIRVYKVVKIESQKSPSLVQQVSRE